MIRRGFPLVGRGPIKQFPDDRLIGGRKGKAHEVPGPHPAPGPNAQRLHFSRSINAIMSVERDLEVAVGVVDFDELFPDVNVNS